MIYYKNKGHKYLQKEHPVTQMKTQIPLGSQSANLYLKQWWYDVSSTYIFTLSLPLECAVT